MSKKNRMYQTESGVAIPESDIEAIEKSTRNRTIVNVLAGVGAVSLGFLAYSFVQSARDNKTPEDDE